MLIETRPVPGWYWAGAVASLLCMLLGCLALTMHFTANLAELSMEQRAQFEAEPTWVLIFSAIAILAGTLGALLLVIRRRVAEPVLLVSAIAVVIWFIGMFASPGYRPLMTSADVVIATVVTALTCLVYLFARSSRQKGWLR